MDCLSVNLTRRAPSQVRAARRWATFVVTAATVLSCVASTACNKSGASNASPDSSSSAAANPSAPAVSSAEQMAHAIPILQSVIDAQVNPTGKPRYEGPFGDVEGTITVTGDPPPDLTLPVRIPPTCGEAAALYRKLFRAGPKGELADAIAAVTDYDAYVPSVAEVKQVRIHGCAYDARTLMLTFGERLEITNGDAFPYMPGLLPAHLKAEMIALPGGDAIRIYPPEPRLFVLTDDLLHPWMHADVYVLKYATHDVSALDGHYHIVRVPPGKVKLSVRHPSIPHTFEREIEVKAGEVTHVDVEIPFNAKTDVPPPPPVASVPTTRANRGPR